MVKITRADPVADAIYAAYEEHAEDWRRDHHGASQVGDQKCQRQVWYGWRWVAPPNFGGWDPKLLPTGMRDRAGRMLRLFTTGDREEQRIVDDLRRMGCEVVDVNPATGEQWRVSFTGRNQHVGGGADGAVLGVPGAKKTWHLLEVKTMNDRRFRDLCRDGVRKAQPGHYAQMQLYMLGLGLRRALYVVVHKDTDTIRTERVNFDPDYADGAMGRAEAVAGAMTPPERISTDPTWWECKFCDHLDHCNLGETGRLQRNCRTCCSSTPRPDGTWWCEYHERSLTPDDQRDGCGAHVFIPQVLPWTMLSACEEEREVVYEDEDGVRVIDSCAEFHSA